jgi:predicted esterase
MIRRLSAFALLLVAAACGDSANPDPISPSQDASVGDTTAPTLPTIASFVATPNVITVGATSTLSWTASGSLTLDGQPVTASSQVVTPNVTTTYTLKATDGTHQVSATATVTVNPSSVPKAPLPYTPDKPFTVVDSGGTTNWVDVPKSYDKTHQTPITLFVWLHGCGGMSAGDIYNVSPGGSQSWISLAVGGQEGNCWDVNADPARVLTAIADLKTHFNIMPKGVVLGGYSSGGDLTYRTAFYNAGQFAGILVENTSPFRDTGSKQTASLAAATWKFNIVHLAHLQDMTYPIAGVRTETDAVKTAGFPIKRVEVDGGHYDNPNAIENGHSVPGTNADLQTILLPYLSAGWKAP